MSGAVTPLPQYASMEWCLVKAQGQLYLYLLRNEIRFAKLFFQNPLSPRKSNLICAKDDKLKFTFVITHRNRTEKDLLLDAVSLNDLNDRIMVQSALVHCVQGIGFRTITFDDIKDKEVLGIPAYVYMASKSLMDNGTMDPNNWCNCGGTCVPQGVLNVSACRYGAPGFVSYPHFLYADPYFSEKVKGMNPDPMKHESHITLEPVSISGKCRTA